MKSSMMTAALVTLLALGGCATKGTPSASTATSANNAPTTATNSAAATLPAQPVKVPALSAKKVVLNLSGPKNVTEAKDWAGFKEEWRATFAEHAKDAGIVFSMQDGLTQTAAADGTLVNVYVNDYRMVGIGARIFLGVMTGNAYIDAKVQFSDLNNGQPFGVQSYNTTSSAWAGVFAKMTPQQVDAIAAEVIREIRNN